jgi:quercetin dioxygenase-like cupin family protein
MSYFRDDAVLLDEHPKDTVAEGVVLERRSMLRLSAATLAAGLAAACSAPAARSSSKAGSSLAAAGAPVTDGTLDLTGFLAEMYPRAQAFIASGGEREEAYLMAIGELMARVQPPAPAQARADMKSFLEQNPPVGKDLEILVVMFALEPGKGFTHHDHRDYNGVILGVEGEAHVTNYDILGDTLVPPEGETFQIRQTRDDLILPGRFSSLGSTRENVHELIAGPDGATVLDVFTYLQPGARSYFMDVDPKPRDAERRIYDATWSERGS